MTIKQMLGLFLVGSLMYAVYDITNNRGLERCKRAGWDFIGQTFSFSREKDRKTYTEQGLKELRYLQSRVATNCILGFD